MPRPKKEINIEPQVEDTLDPVKLSADKLSVHASVEDSEQDQEFLKNVAMTIHGALDQLSEPGLLQVSEELQDRVTGITGQSWENFYYTTPYGFKARLDVEIDESLKNYSIRLVTDSADEDDV